MLPVQSGKEFPPQVPVIDFDVWMQICLSNWAAQVAADTAGIRRLYKEFDTDGNGVLSYEEFCALVRACAPSMADLLVDKKLTAMFEEVGTGFARSMSQ